MSGKHAQLASTLHRELQAAMARGLNDPRVRGLVTLTRVEVSDDRKVATAFVTVLPPEAEDLTLHGLKAAARHLRRQAGDRIRTRDLPDLVFKPDRAAKRQAEVLDALSKARAEFKDHEGETGTDRSGGTGAEPSATVEPDPTPGEGAS